MAEIEKTNLKGTTLLETLFAMIIISLAFGFSITFMNNKAYSNNLQAYKDSLELRKIYNTDEIFIDQTDNTFVIKETVFLDSLCLIKETFVYENKKQSVIEINPIMK